MSTFDSIENISDSDLEREFEEVKEESCKNGPFYCAYIIPISCEILQAEKQNKINLNYKCGVTLLPCFNSKSLLEWNVETTGAIPSISKMSATRQILGARLVRF
ncbi:hypothetical protein Y032_0076g1036 [Ancylostoma ceylanicum]|uniref:Uncharacterized protein n=1 Tax=Ancylostoma ceylanicum TaxID=53326 RepID=A0A016TVJ2_9BILA|nr:hypothetical protein Y032_0076g1036 [Ancylostoma ceylanicum]